MSITGARRGVLAAQGPVIDRAAQALVCHRPGLDDRHVRLAAVVARDGHDHRVPLVRRGRFVPDRLRQGELDVAVPGSGVRGDRGVGRRVVVVGEADLGDVHLVHVRGRGRRRPHQQRRVDAEREDRLVVRIQDRLQRRVVRGEDGRAEAAIVAAVVARARGVSGGAAVGKGAAAPARDHAVERGLRSGRDGAVGLADVDRDVHRRRRRERVAEHGLQDAGAGDGTAHGDHRGIAAGERAEVGSGEGEHGVAEQSGGEGLGRAVRLRRRQGEVLGLRGHAVARHRPARRSEGDRRDVRDVHRPAATAIVAADQARSSLATVTAAIAVAIGGGGIRAGKVALFAIGRSTRGEGSAGGDRESKYKMKTRYSHGRSMP